MIGVAIAVREVFHQELDEVLRLGIDADLVVLELRLFGDESDGVVQRADLVDQAEFQGLLAGEDAAGGQFVDRLLELRAAGGDDVAFEDAVDVVHPALHFLAFRFGEHRVGTEQPGVGAAAAAVPSDADLVPHVGGGELSADHADRGGDRRGVGEDRVGAHRDVVSAAAGHLPIETTNGFLALTRFVALRMISLATADPPGELTRSTTALTSLSSAILSRALRIGVL